MRKKENIGLLEMRIPAYLAGVLMILVFSCEERFMPPIDPKYDNLLAVEGQITNMPGPYTVYLSSSLPLEGGKYTPLSGYRILIVDNLGNEETLTESESGVYTTAEDGIQGIVGREYKLEIESPTGRAYTTNFDVLLNPVGIDSLYFKLEYLVDDDSFYDIAGYQFYTDTKIPEQDTTYYLWELDATYRYQADFIIRWMYDGELHPYTASDSLRYCFMDKNIHDIFTFSTANLTSPRLTDYPLHYVSTLVRDLSIRYSLHMKQFTISEESHLFWEKVREQNKEATSLYTKQPYQIRSNVYSLDNPDEPVLGHFMVAGVAEKRIFVDRPTFPVIMRYPVCMLTEADYMNFGVLFLTGPSEWPQYATFDNNGGNAYPNQECLDCRLRGGKLEAPEFWINP